ncbi:MAG: hypothetical protein K2G96_05015, partial [Clostridia bacterium]|nr:hypothetical protein [Clostridia bacterium]
ITQCIVFVLLYGTVAYFTYLPYLILLGVVSGAIVGGVIMLIFKKVPQSVFEKAIYKREKK